MGEMYECHFQLEPTTQLYTVLLSGVRSVSWQSGARVIDSVEKGRQHSSKIQGLRLPLGGLMMYFMHDVFYMFCSGSLKLCSVSEYLDCVLQWERKII